MSARTAQVLDEYGRPVPGATVYVYKPDGTSAVLTSNGTVALAQPVTTDEFGNYTYWAASGIYREDTWFGGKLRYREVVAIGDAELDIMSYARDAAQSALDATKNGAAQVTLAAAQVAFASAQADRAEAARDLALEGIAPNHVFTSQAAGEAGTVNGDIFKVYDGVSMRIDVRQRTGGGSTHLYYEATTGVLDAQAAHTLVGGAAEDNATDDAATIEGLIAARANIAVDPGTAMVVPDSLLGAVFRNQSGSPFYAAVQINASGRRISGPGTIRPSIRPGASGSEVEFAMATPPNSVRGTYKDITFSGLTFDMENGAGGANTNQRGIHAIGVDRLSLLNTTFLTSITRRGAAVYNDNSRYTLSLGMRLHQLSGGYNSKYGDDQCITGFIAGDSNEPFDFDGTARGLVLSSGVFRGDNTRTQQPVDINGQRDAVFGMFAVSSYGGFTVSYKSTTPPDYATFLQYRTRVPGAAYALGDHIIVEPNGKFVCTTAGTASASSDSTIFPTATIIAGGDVTDGTVVWHNEGMAPWALNPNKRNILTCIAGSGMGAASNHLIVIGNEWNEANNLRHDGYGPVEDIVVDKWMVNDTTPIYAWEARRLLISGVHLSDVIMPAGVATSAIELHSQVTGTTGLSYEWSDLTATLRDVQIDTVPLSGVSVWDARQVIIDNLRTRRTNQLAQPSTYSLQLRNLNSRGADVKVSNIDVDGPVLIAGFGNLVVAWTPSTQIYKNMLRSNGGKFYRATVSGITATSGGPTGTGTAIVDGAVTWEYLGLPYRVEWANTNKVGGSITLSGDAHRYIFGRTVKTDLGDLSATGTVVRPAFLVERRCILARASVMAGATTTAASTNTRMIDLRVVRAGVDLSLRTQSVSSGAQLTAFVPQALYNATAHYGTNAELEPGDVVYWNVTSANSGVAITGLEAQIEVIDK